MDQQTVLRACVISNTHSSQWPLVIDPLEMVCRWLRGRKEMLKEEIVIVKYQVSLSHIYFNMKHYLYRDRKGRG